MNQVKEKRNQENQENFNERKIQSLLLNSLNACSNFVLSLLLIRKKTY